MRKIQSMTVKRGEFLCEQVMATHNRVFLILKKGLELLSSYPAIVSEPNLF